MFVQRALGRKGLGHFASERHGAQGTSCPFKGIIGASWGPPWAEVRPWEGVLGGAFPEAAERPLLLCWRPADLAWVVLGSLVIFYGTLTVSHLLFKMSFNCDYKLDFIYFVFVSSCFSPTVLSR